MSKIFNLTIMTPEKEVFDGDAEAVTVTTTDGVYTFLANHTPLIMPLIAGEIAIKKDGIWSKSHNTEGFAETRKQGIRIFVQTCKGIGNRE